MKKEIIEICNLGLSNEKTIELVEKLIASSLPYDHTNVDARIACGISLKSLDIDMSARTQSNLIEQIENQFTKRELAFLVHSITWRLSKVYTHWFFGRILKKLLLSK